MRTSPYVVGQSGAVTSPRIELRACDRSPIPMLENHDGRGRHIPHHMNGRIPA
ncbi:MAG: hypothetical protein LKE62_00065 [Acetobacter sp.]|nr:hypothetical protein [Acetobacter sp.]